MYSLSHPSFIWSRIKHEFQVVKANSRCLVRIGENLFFWLNVWCGDQKLVDQLNIPNEWHQSLCVRVCMFIQNHHWDIPQGQANNFASLIVLVEKLSILLSGEPGYLIWLGTDSCDLSLKEAFLFKDKTRNHPHWANSLWSIDIIPSKYLVT